MSTFFDEGARRARTLFERLGNRVEAEWHAAMYDDRALPLIAERALVDDPPHLGVSPENVLHWALGAGSLGLQPNAEFAFGEPPITVYSGRRFYIEVLFWFSGTTSIHQHSFDGAFAVLAGSSVHSTYDFVEVARTSARVVVGDLRHQQSEVLRRGDVRAIGSGGALIHSLFHLEHPSVSIVIRNRESSSAGPQYSYFPPYVAVDAFDRTLWNRRAVDYAKAALAMGLDDAEGIVSAAIARADDLGAVQIMSAMLEGAGSDDEAEAPASRRRPPREGLGARVRGAAIEAGRRKFGALAEPILWSLDENQRLVGLRAVRERARRPDHRYFLALLMNVPSVARLLELVGQTHPDGDPIAKCAAWLSELTRGDEPLIDYRLDAHVITLIECLMRSPSFDEAAALMGRLFGRPLSLSEVDAIKATAATLREVPVVRPLLSGFDAPPAGELLALVGRST
jgi:hypothetical protein